MPSPATLLSSIGGNRGSANAAAWALCATSSPSGRVARRLPMHPRRRRSLSGSRTWRGARAAPPAGGRGRYRMPFRARCRGGSNARQCRADAAALRARALGAPARRTHRHRSRPRGRVVPQCRRSCARRGRAPPGRDASRDEAVRSPRGGRTPARIRHPRSAVRRWPRRSSHRGVVRSRSRGSLRSELMTIAVSGSPQSVSSRVPISAGLASPTRSGATVNRASTRSRNGRCTSRLCSRSNVGSNRWTNGSSRVRLMDARSTGTRPSGVSNDSALDTATPGIGW